MCFYRGRYEEFKIFFSQEERVMFFNDDCSVMDVVGYDTTQIICTFSSIRQK
jgi:hypothetical protein